MRIFEFGRRALGLLVFFLLSSFSCAFAQGGGYWHTSGDLILDANNQRVRIAGINWYGFETATAVAGGLTSQDYKAVLKGIQAQGYNTVRIPFSNQMIESPNPSPNISFYNSTGPINTDLQGLNSLAVLDKIVIYAGTIGLKVILDNHRSEAGNSAEANGLWFTSAYPESAWINDWTMLAKRYLYLYNVVGFDLRDEPHNAYSGGACWDCGGANDWHLAAERAGNAILGVNPNLLIFVEGTDAYNNDYYWWGGNLEGVATSPVKLSVPNQLVYSAHDYGPHEYAQTWFNGGTSYASLSTVWTKHWAYISQQNIAPVWLGEFGTTNVSSDIQASTAGSQGQWFSSLVQYLNADPSLNWTYWALNGEDSYGLLSSNYAATPVSALKQSTLATIQSPLNSGTGTTVPPTAPTNLVASAVSSSQVNLAWTPSVTPSVYYTVYYGTSPSSVGTVLVSGLTTASYQATGLNASTTYYFVVKAVSSQGTSAGSNVASATTPMAPIAPATGLSASASSPSQIDLTWTPSTTPNVMYTLYQGTSVGAMTTIVSGHIIGTYYPIIGLNAGTTYYFTLIASVGGASSVASVPASATTIALAAPAPPTGLTASAVSTSQINVTWVPSSGTGITYALYKGLSAGNISTLVANGLTGTVCAATGLTASTAYFFAVRAINTAGASGASNSASATTQTPPPAAPAGLTATAASTTQMTLAWSPVSGTSVTYSVYVGQTPSTTTTMLTNGLSGTSFQVNNLNASTTYYFAVTATSASGTSPQSAVVAGTTAAPPPPPSTSAPTGLVATATSSSQISLTWVASATPNATYSVFGGNSSGAMNPYGSGISATGFQVTGLTPGTTYYFVVTASAAGITSNVSNQASATTQPPPPPVAPAGLSATGTSASQIALTWSPSSTNGVSYSVYSGSKAGAETTLLASGVNGTAYQANGLTAGSTYYFVVTAVSGGVASKPSNEAHAATSVAAIPGTPSGLTATATSSSQINLTWTASSTSGVQYTVYRGTSAGAVSTVVASGLTSTNYTMTGLSASTAYYFAVTATAPGGTSPTSNVATATTKALSFCHVDYSDLNDWGFGFTGGISITNNSSTPITAWTVTWTYGGTQQVSQSWNGDFVQKGQTVSITSAAWNGSIPAGSTQSNIGFNATYTGSNANPTNFSVNGVPCN